MKNKLWNTLTWVAQNNEKAFTNYEGFFVSGRCSRKYFRRKMVTLPHSLFNSIVAEVVRWNDVISNISIQPNLLPVK